ncbi:hypothetical protein NMG60_11016418 [Bertholletia excelsa]
MIYWSSKDAPAPLPVGSVQQFLQKFDKNGDGKLSREELRLAFKSQGFHFCHWRAKIAIRHADNNGDNCISDDELNKLLQYVSSEWGFKVVS